jgi:pyruvate kinase
MSAPREQPTFVKTKIVATVGPAIQNPERLRELVVAGVDVFRLNFAHGRHDWLAGIVAAIRDVSRQLNRPVGILADLAGPKIRLEEIPGGSAQCELGQEFIFARTADSSNPRVYTCTYEKLIDDLRVDDRIMLADGSVALRVTSKPPTNDRVICVVEQPGEIRSRQGVNLPGVSLSTPSLTDKDLADLGWALRNEIDFVSLSFVRSGRDLAHLREEMARLKPARVPLVVSKIEKVEAVQELDQILELTDVVMVARGDLGVEADLAQVPILQKRIIKLCNQHRVPVITATQMLESMTNNNIPTRAEATDVANAVLDGTDAVMLSGETAIGAYPLDTVRMMSRIAREAERILPVSRPADPAGELRSRALAVTEAVTLGAVKAAGQLSADLIVVVTKTGKTALALSWLRGTTPVIALTVDPTVARQLTLCWGITPIATPIAGKSPNEILKFVTEWGRREQILTKGSKIVLVTSSAASDVGHDLMMIHSVT